MFILFSSRLKFSQEILVSLGVRRDDFILLIIAISFFMSTSAMFSPQCHLSFVAAHVFPPLSAFLISHVLISYYFIALNSNLFIEQLSAISDNIREELINILNWCVNYRSSSSTIILTKILFEKMTEVSSFLPYFAIHLVRTAIEKRVGTKDKQRRRLKLIIYWNVERLTLLWQDDLTIFVHSCLFICVPCTFVEITVVTGHHRCFRWTMIQIMCYIWSPYPIPSLKHSKLGNKREKWIPSD